MTAWHEKIQRIAELKGESRYTAPRRIEQFGWQHNDKLGFMTSERLFLEDGTDMVTAIPDHMVTQHFKPRGSEAEWRRMVRDALVAEHIETEVLIASAFAAPLVKFTGHRGLLLSAISTESGTGKSLALKLAQSVWADPVNGMFHLRDTPNSITKRAGVASDMPCIWDEVRVSQDPRSKAYEEVANLMFQLTQGRDRSRLNQDSTVKMSLSWRTLLVTASNRSMTNLLQMADEDSDAGSWRMLEFNVGPLDNTKAVSNQCFKDINQHSGHIGPQYAQWLVVNHKTVDAMVSKVMTQLRAKLGDEHRYRFYVDTIAVLLVGAQLAKKLGFVDFNVVGIRDFLFDLFKKRLILVEGAAEEGSNPERSNYAQLIRAIKQFMNKGRDGTYITDLHKPVDEMTPLLISGKSIEMRNAHPVWVRVVTHPNNECMIINQPAFNQWLRTSSVDGAVVKGQIRTLQADGLISDRGPSLATGLGAGVTAATGGPKRWVIKPCAELAELFTEEEE